MPNRRRARTRLAGLGRTWMALALAAAVGIFVIESRPNNHHDVTMRVLRAVHRVVF